MPTLVLAAIAVGWASLGALAMAVLGQLLTGGINCRGLLHVKQRVASRGDASISPARVQLLLATLVTAGNWLANAWMARASGTLPDVDVRWLYGIGASQGVYLASKGVQLLTQFGARRQPLA